jgi:hypothetical protein
MTVRIQRDGSARRVALVVIALLVPMAAAAEAEVSRGVEGGLGPGGRIYRDGVLPAGRPLQGTAQGGVRRSGADAACVGCHRRSGLGASEGAIRIPPITGPALRGPREVLAAAAAARAAPAGLSPANAGVAAEAGRLSAKRARLAAQQGPQRRPSYDDRSLARAIREGVDPTGRPLDPGMPRYRLDDEEMQALIDYLGKLSAETAPGVTDRELHLATVVQPGVDPAQRRAMLDVLQGFVRDKNAGSRSEERRRAAGGEGMYRGWRRWVLHVWELTGPPDGWSRQLETWYERQPVFALVGGLGTTSWRPIAEFSERLAVPCLFPQVELPAVVGVGFYTVYLSKGLALEAEALSKHLRDRGAAGAITQVYREEGASAAAAAAFRAAASAAGGSIALDERRVEGVPERDFWERLAQERAGSTLVVWLPAADLVEAGALLGPAAKLEAVYLSATLAGERPALASGDRVRLVNPLDLPRARGARLLRVKRWLHEKGIALTDEKVQMNAYFAVTVLADALAHMADVFSRDYLVERIEHAVGNAVAPTVYPRVSLGPGQRFASKGSYVVRFGGRGPGRELEPVSGWITP